MEFTCAFIYYDCYLPNLCRFDVDGEGTGGDGTGLEETGGQASSQQLIPPTEFHHQRFFT